MWLLLSHRDEEVIIGIDLFGPLGFQILGVPFAWPDRGNCAMQGNAAKREENVTLPTGVDENGIAREWESVLARNQAISVFELNNIPDSELHLPTGDHKPIFIHQYPVPEAL